MNDYLYIFLHILRTGGTTFRRHLIKNFRREQRLALKYKKERLGKKNLGLDYYKARTEEKIKKLSTERKRKIKVIYGHGVTYGVHEYFNRPAKYIVFLRDPTKRTMSLYNYILMGYKDKKKKGIDVSEYKYALLVNGQIPSFDKWIRQKYGVSGTSSETIAQQLNLLGYLKVENVESMKEMLNRFYYVGLTEKLDTDLKFLYPELGINKYFLKINISKKYVTNMAGKTKALLNEKNKTDRVIYEMGKKKRERFINKTPDYYERVRKVKLKRTILLPFTQFLFDFKGGLVEISSFLKRTFPFYEKAFYFIRGYKERE